MQRDNEEIRQNEHGRGGIEKDEAWEGCEKQWCVEAQGVFTEKE